MRLVSRFADELRVKTKGGWQIYFGTRIPLEASLEALQLLFEKELPEERHGDLEYIDLRTENRVFYRYKEGIEEARVMEQASIPKPEEPKQEKKSDKKKER